MEKTCLLKRILGQSPIKRTGVATAGRLLLVNVDVGMWEKYGGERVFLETATDDRYLEHSKTSFGWAATTLEVERPDRVR